MNSEVDRELIRQGMREMGRVRSERKQDAARARNRRRWSTFPVCTCGKKRHGEQCARRLWIQLHGRP